MHKMLQGILSSLGFSALLIFSLIIPILSVFYSLKIIKMYYFAYYFELVWLEEVSNLTIPSCHFAEDEISIEALLSVSMSEIYSDTLKHSGHYIV